MPRLRFVFGPSGAGKSTTVYREVIERSLLEPERNFLILVPDQFTMQAQADVVRLHPSHGIMNIDVLSFSRLFHRIFDETHRARETVLDDLGKMLVLRHAAQTLQDALPVIGANMRRAGYVDEVKSTLSEFMQYDISPEAMEKMIEACAGRRELRDKLADLKTLYAAFRGEIEDRFLCAEDVYTVAAAQIARSRLVRDAVVVFDAFTGFTPVQYRVLSALYRAARELILTVTLGEEENPYRPDDGHGLFALSKKTVHDVTFQMYRAEKEDDPQQTPPFDVWEAHRRKTAGDLFLRAEKQSRLHANAGMTFLENNLFRFNGRAFPGETDAVQMFAASSPAEEVRQTFRKIRAMMRRDSTLQFRDFAILSAAWEEYADLLLAGARDFDIPVYEDKTSNLRFHPMIEYLRSIPEMIRTGFSTESVMHYLRSGMAPYERKDADYMERYLTANGIRGKSAFSRPFIALPADRVRRTEEESLAVTQTAERIRATLMAHMRELLEACESRAGVKRMTRALYRMVRADKTKETLEAMARSFSAAGDEQAAGEYRQIFSRIERLFESMVYLLGGEDLSIEEYADVLEAGFSEISIGTIPRSVDRVMIGDLQRTRLKEVKVLFLTGADDRVIPKRAQAGGLLSEIDRDYLKRHLDGMELAPSPAEQIHIERLYLYMNLTKPAKALFLSYARVDAAQKSTRESYLFALLRRMYPALKTAFPEADAFAEQMETARDAKKRMAPLLRRYADGLATGEENASFPAVFRILHERDSRKQTLLTHAFSLPARRALTPALAASLYARVTRNSTSRMERFAACAYAHFIRYGLRLAEAAEYDLNDADLGNVYHGVLAAFSERLASAGISWKDFDDGTGRALIKETVRAFCASYGGVLLNGTARMKYLTERMERVLVRTVRTLRYQTEKGALLPSGAEVSFSRSIGAGDAQLLLYGRIDRVDTLTEDGEAYLKVMDFKSGKRDFEPALLYHGLQLQLMMYMDAALEEARNRTGAHAHPAALLYYHILDPVVDLDKQGNDGVMDDAAVEKALREQLRTTGIVNGDDRVVRMLDASFEKKSDVIPVSRNADGSFSKGSDVFTEEEYGVMSAYTANVLESFHARMTGGEIEANPYAWGDKAACDYCPYRPVCGFDASRAPGYRVIGKMTTQEALERMREETGKQQQAGGKTK